MPVADAFKRFAVRLVWATVLTGVVGEVLIKLVEHTMFKGAPKAEIEDLFGRLDLVAPALAGGGDSDPDCGTAGEGESGAAPASVAGSITRRPSGNVTMRQAGWMGLVQGLCLPFRGFSRSGATISTGMLTDAPKERAERFSFALAVVITPLAIGREALRLLHATQEAAATGTPIDLHGTLVFSLLGAVFAFLGGAGGAEVAEQLAGERALVSVRDLLPGGQRGGVRGCIRGVIKLVRAEDIVGLELLPGTFRRYWVDAVGITRPVGSRERSLWQGTGLGVEGFALLVFGLATSVLDPYVGTGRGGGEHLGSRPADAWRKSLSTADRRFGAGGCRSDASIGARDCAKETGRGFGISLITAHWWS